MSDIFDMYFQFKKHSSRDKDQCLIFTWYSANSLECLTSLAVVLCIFVCVAVFNCYLNSGSGFDTYHFCVVPQVKPQSTGHHGYCFMLPYIEFHSPLLNQFKKDCVTLLKKKLRKSIWCMLFFKNFDWIRFYTSLVI